MPNCRFYIPIAQRQSADYDAERLRMHLASCKRAMGNLHFCGDYFVMTDSNQRRAFYCQDSLWQSFTNLAIQRSTTVDALINEAMAYYARSSGAACDSCGVSSFPGGGQPVQNYPSQNYNPPQSQSYGQQAQNYGQQAQNYGQPQAQEYPQQAVNYNASIPAPPVRQSYGAGIAPAPQQPLGARVPPPAPPTPYRRPPSIFEDSPAEAARKPMVLASLQQNNAPQQNYNAGAQGYNQAQSAQAQASQPPLYIVFAGQRYVVDKDKYIIGRSSQLADLVIRDANISRKHCAVIFKNGSYYIKDLDSTNGIEYKGNRIDTKRIDEGDQFNICEFNFTFTYR